MMHDVWYEGFHGCGYIRFRGPAGGFDLSPSQVRRWRSTVCPFAGSGCLCLGVVPPQFSRIGASIEPTEDGGYRLIPCTSAEVI